MKPESSTGSARQKLVLRDSEGRTDERLVVHTPSVTLFEWIEDVNAWPGLTTGSTITVEHADE